MPLEAVRTQKNRKLQTGNPKYSTFWRFDPKRVLTRDSNVVSRISRERDKLQENGKNPRMPKETTNPNPSTNSPSKTPVARHFRSRRRQLRRRTAPERAHSAQRGSEIRIRDRKTKPSHHLGGAPCSRWTQDARVQQQLFSHDQWCRAKLAESFLR